MTWLDDFIKRKTEPPPPLPPETIQIRTDFGLYGEVLTSAFASNIGMFVIPDEIVLPLFKKLYDEGYKGNVKYLWDTRNHELISIELDGSYKETVWSKDG